MTDMTDIWLRRKLFLYAPRIGTFRRNEISVICVIQPCLEAKNGESDVCDVSDVLPEGPGGAPQTTPETSPADTFWAEQAAMPAMVLRDRVRRTEHPETKKRLLDLARSKEEEEVS